MCSYSHDERARYLGLNLNYVTMIIDRRGDVEDMQNHGNTDEKRGLAERLPGTNPRPKRIEMRRMCHVLSNAPSSISKDKVARVADGRVQLAILQEALGKEPIRIGILRFVMHDRPA